MILLNLLSPQYKQELQAKRVLIAVKEIVMLVLLFTSVIAILLVGSKNKLKKQLKKLITDNRLQIEVHDQINNQIIAINNKIRDINNIQTDYKKWSNFLIKLTTNTPNNIQYQFLKLNRLENVLEIKGVAKSRDSLLQFKSSLEGLGFFTGVDLPLGDLLARENNTFTIRTTLNPEIDF